MQKFVGYPTNSKGKYQKTYISSTKSTASKKRIKQVFWGDYLKVVKIHSDGWTQIEWGPEAEAITAYIPSDHTADLRPLEIVFVDVGQGDGAVLITPEIDRDEKVIVIDAGERHGMHDFLKGRFGKYMGERAFHAAIITHPDKDHYLGFEDIFANHDFGFDKIYQSGLVERPVSGDFEKLNTDKSQQTHVTDLALSRADIETHFADDSNFGRFEFPPVMHAALNNPRISDFEMLSRKHSTQEGGTAWLPGFAPSDGRLYSIEVLGPVVEQDDQGRDGLNIFSRTYSYFKNGHSVLLRLHFGTFKVFFGGDLNSMAEKYLLKHYTGRNSIPKVGGRGYDDMLAAARPHFEADVMKVCHHGAADVTDQFLAAVNPTAFVISSGDQEGHVHPRPDLLGRLGKMGNSDSPVILSTELQRSVREKQDAEVVEALSETLSTLDAKPTEAELEDMLGQVRELGRSNIQVNGAIYLKTDGERLVTAFRKETDSETDRWFHFEYKLKDGELIPVS